MPRGVVPLMRCRSCHNVVVIMKSVIIVNVKGNFRKKYAFYIYFFKFSKSRAIKKTGIGEKKARSLTVLFEKGRCLNG